MRMQIFQTSQFRSFACLALLIVALLMLGGQAYAQSQIPNLSFSTSGIGVASATSGALRGDIKFYFHGRITNGRMWMGATVKLPQTPSGSAPKLWRVRAIGYNGDTINQQGKPQVEFRTTDPTYYILTIYNLPAAEDFTHTNSLWNGVMKLTLRFSKINGVSDSFSVEFSPISPQGNPPAAVRGTICNARPKVGSDLILKQ